MQRIGKVDIAALVSATLILIVNLNMFYNSVVYIVSYSYRFIIFQLFDFTMYTFNIAFVLFLAYEILLKDKKVTTNTPFLIGLIALGIVQAVYLSIEFIYSLTLMFKTPRVTAVFPNPETILFTVIIIIYCFSRLKGTQSPYTALRPISIIAVVIVFLFVFGGYIYNIITMREYLSIYNIEFIKSLIVWLLYIVSYSILFLYIFRKTPTTISEEAKPEENING